ncbi:nuclear pore complex protein Nup50-like isoform X2 [Tachypleus tridentatus]|uniref:nuclear pore complex protein Nup50-like isoform X2 n=1 Tax=Tachypleus tridentatus TaxID=6853 RepID=UPI003FD34E9B
MPAFGDYEKYIIKIEKKYFVQNLQTETPSVQENILSDLQFPSKYTVDERGIKHTFNSGSKATKKESTKKENSVNFKSFPPALSTTSMSTSSFGFQPTSSSSTSSVSGKSFFRLENGEVSSTLVTNVLTTTTTTTPYLAGFSFKTCDNSSTSDRVSKPPPACFATEKCPVHELKEAAQNTDRIADHHRIKYSQVEKNNALFSKRCKLFCKKGNCYMDKGIGILYIKMVQRKSQLLIKADSNIGDILLNIRLNSTVQLKRVGKNNVLIVYNPNPSLDLKSSTTEPVTFLIHVNTSEEADELLLKLNHFMS